MRSPLMRRIMYYKWHIFVIVFCLISAYIIHAGNDEKSDLRFVFISDGYMNVQNFKDNKGEIELLLNDSDGNGKKVASLSTYHEKTPEDAAKRMKEFIKNGQFDIYISNKEAFEKIEDKSVFESTDSFLIDREEYTYLSDSTGRNYGVSLDSNSLAERIGINQTKNMYIAVRINYDGDERAATMKNAMNISGYIIKNKNKYQI